jgi:hypothetical protein
VRADLRTYEKWACSDPLRARQPRAKEAEAKVDGMRTSGREWVKRESEQEQARESERERERLRESKGGRVTEWGTAAERGNSVG